MLKIAQEKPGFHYMDGYGFICNRWFWMSVEDYLEKKEFTEFDVEAIDWTTAEREIADQYVKQGKVPDLDLNDLLVRVVYPNIVRYTRLLKMASYGRVYQFPAISHDFEGHARVCITLGGKELRRWSWLEAYVKYPLTVVICRVLNGLKVPVLIEKLT